MLISGQRLPMNPPLPRPAATAEEAAALETLWEDLQPALKYYFQAPTVDPTKAPALDNTTYMRIYTAIVNALMSSRAGHIHSDNLYARINKYYAVIAREAFVEAPQDDNELVNRLIRGFQRFSAGALAASHLLNFLNRTYIKKEVVEDEGRTECANIQMCMPLFLDEERRAVLLRRAEEMRAQDLKDWGYVEGDSREVRERAKACAQAASSERVVPFIPLAYRHFRVEVIEPLLADPDSVAAQESGATFSPHCRLARGVQTYIIQGQLDEEGKRHAAKELATILQITGMKITHPLWKTLDDLTTSH